ncbi:MAG TPA: aspartate 1-decarboxylase [Spirochaetota bacterium]|nr:aspartate 1-decarboxylase [Spirochaetota bacterium]HOL56667.1 aspartate 1-decarboxylase [Spirochaetota bacterium]HPP03303.1 aspartate 1-decarboxylase [Spirochaetota bacterium]
MLLNMMKSKIHRATITECILEYEGSITIDEDLLERANMLEFEKVQVLNMNNGARLETYIIKGERNSGIICLNGPAARLGYVGDEVVIISYAIMTEEEAKSYKPIVVKVDKKNRAIM